MSKEKILDRVRKLLALANNNSNENESQNAMLQAQKMLAQNGLTMTDVDILKEKTKTVIEKDGTDYTRLTWWQKTLSSIIDHNFRCYSFMRSEGRGKRKLVFMGLKEDVEIATEVYKFAVEDIKYQSRMFIQKNGKDLPRSHKNAMKNDYITGYLQGLKAKFAEQVEKEGWGLILVKDDAVIKKYEGMTMRKDRVNSVVSSLGDNKAFTQGFKDGKQFRSNIGALTGEI